MRHFHESKLSITFDLHVLSTPPAFVLSQDQTLQFYITETFSSVHSLLTYFNKSSVRLLFSFQRPALLGAPFWVCLATESEYTDRPADCQALILFIFSKDDFYKFALPGLENKLADRGYFKVSTADLFTI